MISVFFRWPYLACLLIFFIFIPLISQPAWSLTSQQSRFEGMSSTFKAKKKAIEEAAAKEQAARIKKEQEEVQAKQNQPETESSYFKLHTFVVNVEDKRVKNRLVFLTLEVYCEIRDVNDRDLIDTHMAPIKDAIITHVSGMHREQIQTPKQKKELQKYLSDKAAALIQELTGKSIISGLYLTRILIQ